MLIMTGHYGALPLTSASQSLLGDTKAKGWESWAGYELRCLESSNAVYHMREKKNIKQRWTDWFLVLLNINL